MLGVLFGACALLGVKYFSQGICNPAQEKDFDNGFWAGCLGGIVCIVINLLI